MSWRLLFFTLLILAGISTVGGLYAGDWLIAHAPTRANLPNVSENDPAPRVGPDGRPLMRQPPQLLMSGRIGVPSNEVNVDWKVKAENLSKEQTASTTIDPSAFTFGSTTQLTAQVTTANSAAQTINTRPIGQGTQGGSVQGGGGWVASFNREMAACRQLGIFERANCVSNTRQRYCGANNAWGSVRDCPER